MNTDFYGLAAVANPIGYDLKLLRGLMCTPIIRPHRTTRLESNFWPSGSLKLWKTGQYQTFTPFNLTRLVHSFVSHAPTPLAQLLTDFH